GVTSAVEVDVDYPQNGNSNKCGGNGFHKLLTMRIRQVFRAYPLLPEVRQHQRSGVGRLSRTSNPLRTVPERPTCVANLHSSCFAQTARTSSSVANSPRAASASESFMSASSSGVST